MDWAMCCYSISLWDYPVCNLGYRSMSLFIYLFSTTFLVCSIHMTIGNICSFFRRKVMEILHCCPGKMKRFLKLCCSVVFKHSSKTLRSAVIKRNKKTDSVYSIDQLKSSDFKMLWITFTIFICFLEQWSF